MVWLIVGAVVAFIIYRISSRSGHHHVLSQNASGEWIPIHTGSYGSCRQYIESSKGVGISSRFKIEKANF